MILIQGLISLYVNGNAKVMEKCNMCGKMKKASCKMCGGHSPKKKMKKGGASPSAGLSKKEKTEVVKKARAGKDIGKKGKGFAALAKKAGGGEKGKKIAAAAMWKNIKKG
jgi:hypothetical protein